MGKEDLVALVTPDGRRIGFDLVNLVIRRSAETGELVGFGGHTITCPYMDIEAGPECYTCKNESEALDGGPCKLGIPQTDDYAFSRRFEESSLYCKSYKKKEGIKCECGAEEVTS